MAKARELRRRIKSVENTRQITKTMEMVATSRLKRAQDRVVAARPYAESLADVIASLYDPGLAERFRLLRQPEPGPQRVALLFITSNRGLCGGFNANLIRRTAGRLVELEAERRDVELHAIGRKGIGFFRYIGQPLQSARDDIGDRPTAEHATEVMEPLIERFVAGELDAVEVVFAKFNNPLSTPPTLLPILPIRPPEDGPARSSVVPNYILKPSAEAILEVVLPMYVQNQMYRPGRRRSRRSSPRSSAAQRPSRDNHGRHEAEYRQDRSGHRTGAGRGIRARGPARALHGARDQ
jgi:F-type H+-transporting ATPase subunit gamma